MDDTISRQAVLALWDKYHYSIAIHAMEYDEELRSLPSVHPEIIICLDCVHYEPLGKEKAWGRCSVHSSPTDNQRFVQSCDFCAWAERKTNGSD